MNRFKKKMHDLEKNKLERLCLALFGEIADLVSECAMLKMRNIFLQSQLLDARSQGYKPREINFEEVQTDETRTNARDTQ